MYRCLECNAEYKEKVDYCECGNNTFEYIEDKKHLSLDEKSQIVSVVFFAVCIILAILVWFIPTPKQPHKEQPKQTKTVKQQIPDINKIWIEQQPKVTPVTPTSAEYAR